MILAEIEKLRYPIGEFTKSTFIKANVEENIQTIENLPLLLKDTVEGLSNEQLNTPYRTDGWTVRQLAHHLTDSYINLYVRFKLALTEDEPTVKVWQEERWAELCDAKNESIEISLNIQEALIRRLIILLKSLNKAELSRNFIHPDSGKVSIEKCIALLAWHGKHHIAHIKSLKDRNNW